MRSHIVNWKTKLSSIVICFMIFCLLFGCFELGECKKEEDSCQMDVKFSTYLGGTGLEGAGRISLDSSGNIILAASSSSNDFPLVNPFQATKNITEDGVIAKVSPDGQELLFSTYFGGNGDDFLFSTAVDSNDNIIVAGTTDGTTFPLKNALKTNRSASSREVVLAKFSPDGQELYFSTFICGTNSYTVDIVLDSSDNIILGGCTDTEELLATANTYQPNKNNSTDGFITKISADGQTVLFST